jgi:hypothetical protein
MPSWRAGGDGGWGPGMGEACSRVSDGSNEEVVVTDEDQPTEGALTVESVQQWAALQLQLCSAAHPGVRRAVARRTVLAAGHVAPTARHLPHCQVLLHMRSVAR